MVYGVTLISGILLALEIVRRSDSTESFAELRWRKYFVDKSELLKVFLEGGSANLINCPRRFGKSSNLRMIERFLQMDTWADGRLKGYMDSSAYELFKDLAIFKYVDLVERHMSKYAVIYLNLKLDKVVGNFTEEEVIEVLNDKLHECFVDKYTGLFDAASGYLNAKGIHDEEIAFMEKLKLRRLNETDVVVGLRYMAGILHKYYEADVTLLIDNYDAVMVPDALSRPREDIELVYIYINEMIIGVSKCQLRAVSYVLITSTSNLAFGVSEVDLRHFKQRVFLDEHEFGAFFAFTENDVERLMDLYSVSEETTRNRIKECYCGYKTRKLSNLCNPHSVTRFLESIGHSMEDDMRNYWISDEVTRDKVLMELLRYKEFRMIATALVAGNAVYFRRADFGDPTRMDFLNFLLFCKQKDVEYKQYTYGLFVNFIIGQGFLSFDSRRNVFRAPNSEVVNILKEALFCYNTDNFDGIMA